MKISIYTDGASRGNPGPSSLGVVIKDKKGKVLGAWKKLIGIATNNQAEYQALIFGLEKAKKLRVEDPEERKRRRAEEVDCFTDSKLVVEQINRRFKIKDKKLAILFIKAWNLSQSFKKINFYYLAREDNKEADNLANQAYNP